MNMTLEQDNQASILVAKTGYSPKLRHIQRTHKINLGSIHEVLQAENIEIRYCKTDEQVADIVTKAVSPEKWENALQVCNVMTGNPRVSNSNWPRNVKIRGLMTKSQSTAAASKAKRK